MAVRPADAFAQVRAAVGQALAAADPADVRAVVVGLAGAGRLSEPAVRTAFEQALAGVGLLCAPVIAGDVAIAFAAGSPASSGTVLISGTGAIAAKIFDHEPVALADGFGWQLGDEGSAFWLGRAAARAAVRELANAAGRAGAQWVSRRRASRHVGRLTELVAGHLLPHGMAPAPDIGAVDRFATVVQDRPPLALAELAPLVGQAAREGDPAALGIVRQAARSLADTALQVNEPGSCDPVVLAGSVLTSEGPLQRAVRDLLESEGRRVAMAGDGAGAAAWLALRGLVTEAEAVRLHAAFTHPVGH